MKDIIIAPSILSLDYSNVNEQLKQLNESNAKWMHFDVMDGHFVPNLTFGPDILKGFKKAVNMVMDVHIMVSDPKMMAKIFADAGADIITFHYEALNSDEAVLDLIKYCKEELKVKVGISIKPKTSVEVLEAFIELVDLFLIMSVEPGFGGQSFMADMLDKVKVLDKWKSDKSNYLIQIDGGISIENAQQCINAGVDVLVAGSYVFKGNIKDRVNSLLCKQ